MKYTNEKNLPQSIVRAVSADAYSRGESDISVTSLIDAPRQHIIQQAFSGGMAPEVDVSRRLWPLLGTAFHSLMDHDHEPGVIKEERLFMECNGWVVSGAVDRQIERGRKHDIEDFKVTSVYTYMGAEKGEKTGWEEQLNLYAALAEANGREVKDLYIIALLRDWRPMEAKNKAGSGYPQTPIMRMPIKKWTEGARKEFLLDRVQLHQSAQMLWDEGDGIVECSDEERWKSGDKWAVKKTKAARALRVFDTKTDAIAFMSKQGPTPGGFVIDHRIGENRRCEGYCDYAAVCSQWQKINDDKVVEEVMEEMK